MIEDKKYIIALDQGTTSSRAIIFDKNMNIVSTAQKELTQIYPKPGDQFLQKLLQDQGFPLKMLLLSGLQIRGKQR